MKLWIRRKGRTTRERFYDLAMPEPNTGCWLWLGALFTSGYGSFGFWEGDHHRHMNAHRFSWILHFGPIPDGLLICHKCDVRCCVNPEHLFVGTYSDNANDMHAKGRNNTIRGEQHAKARITEDDVRRIRADTRPLGEIGRDYGFDKSYVWKIKNGWHWRHV